MPYNRYYISKHCIVIIKQITTPNYFFMENDIEPALVLLRRKYRGFDKNINPVYTEMGIKKAMKEYARQCCEQVLKDAAENAMLLYHDGVTKEDSKLKYFQYGCDNIQISKQSILNTEIKTP